MRPLALIGLIFPSLLIAEVRVPATYYRVAEEITIRKTESSVTVTDRVRFRRSPFGMNNAGASEGIGWSAFVRLSPAVSAGINASPPLAKDAIKVTASSALANICAFIEKKAHGDVVLGGYYLVELFLDASPEEVMFVEFSYKLDIGGSASGSISFTPTFENSDHIPPVVWEELAAFRIIIEGVPDDRVEVSQGGKKLLPVSREFLPANEPAPYWFRKDGEVVIKFN